MIYFFDVKGGRSSSAGDDIGHVGQLGTQVFFGGRAGGGARGEGAYLFADCTEFFYRRPHIASEAESTVPTPSGTSPAFGRSFSVFLVLYVFIKNEITLQL